MSGIGSRNYVREQRRKRYVEECFSLDSFDVAHQFGRQQRRWLYYDSPWSERNRLSVSVKPNQGRYAIWTMVLDQNLDHAHLWQKIYQIPSEARSTIFAGAQQYWSQGQPLLLSPHLYQLGIFAPQFITSQVGQSPAGASCSWFLCPSIKSLVKNAPMEESSAIGYSGQQSQSPTRQANVICSRRCRKLYWHQGHFACRQCHRLAYASQARTPTTLK